MSSTERQPRRRTSARNLTLALAGAVMLFGVVVGFWAGRLPEGAEQPLGLTILVVAGLLVLAPATLYVALLYWRRLDEAAQEAHKWAWYWGGSLGIIPGLVIASTRDTGVELAGRLGFDEPYELMNFGAHAVLVSMLLGYLIAWGAWWIRRR